MRLYRPDKYKVLVGNDNNKALCTCWFDPYSVTKYHESLKANFTITGTLYSKEGVSIIFRNLALNPQIRYLFLWANTPLSKTPFGKSGWELLNQIWKNPKYLNDIHKEIPDDVIAKIVANVSLIDISNQDFDQVVKADFSNYAETNSYMEPIEFDEPQRDTTAKLPSEKVGWVVRNKTIYETWVLALDRIIRYGHVKKTEYGNLQRELQNINWIIENENVDNIFIPELHEDIKNIIGLSTESLTKYKESLLDPIIPEGTAYTYGSRLRAYSEKNFDQIDFIIDKLKENSITRRAVCTTLIPYFDATQNSPPCLVYVQALVDDENRLNFFATFRSHDIFKAALPNAYGLLWLQNYICTHTNTSRGVLSINSISAHVYEEDWDNATKLLKCQKWETINTRFDEYSDIDPRGIARISTEDKKIKIELSDTSGNIFYTNTNISAREIIMQLAKLDLLSRTDHYLDICIELIKAELAIQLNKDYIQDKPLRTEWFSLK